MTCVMLLYGIMPQLWFQRCSLGTFVKLELNLVYILWRDVTLTLAGLHLSPILCLPVATGCNVLAFRFIRFCAM